MRSRTCVIVACTLLSGGMDMAAGQAAKAPRAGGHVPAAPLELVLARPFEVEVAMPFHVAGGVQQVKKGHVLVLRVDPDLVRPAEEPDHVLFAGDSIAQRVNVGFEDGHVIVIVPERDYTRAPVFFAARAIPDRLTAADFLRARESAAAAGVAAFTRRDWQRALAARPAAFPGRTATGDRFVAHDLNDLWYQTAGLIWQYAPAEREMAASLLPR